jgi:GDPmannose 4,6-dehydratase
MSRVALITGIAGQDGSYLAELLLEKNYIVYGILRRSSIIRTERIDHIFNKLNLVYGDVTDASAMSSVIHKMIQENPEAERYEIYNLAAQSHVQVSFELPSYTAQVDAFGVVNILETIRALEPGVKGRVRFYQASTSELFGKILEKPQTERTPLNPTSPYAIAKHYAHQMVKLYREAYGLFCCSGLLFNHETIAGNMPMIFTHDKNEIDIKPICEIVNYHTQNKGILVDETISEYQQGFVEKDLFVWDANGWTKVKYASGYKHNIENDQKHPKFVMSKNSCYMATGSHHVILEDDSEKEIQEIKIGDKVKLTTLQNIVEKEKLKNELSDFEAEFMGLIVGDGYIDYSNNIRFINSSKELRDYMTELWKKICSKYNKEFKEPHYYPSRSGFSNKIVGYIDFYGNWFLKRTDLYNLDKTKRVPQIILNSTSEIQYEFLKGYNKADGLKKNSCIFEFKNFKTNSPTLACGLMYLLEQTTKQNFNINVEHRIDNKNINRFYYSINIASNTRFSPFKSNEKKEKVVKMLNEGISIRQIVRDTKINRHFVQQINRGYEPPNKHHRSIENNVVKKIIDYDNYDGWFYDLETETGTFFCGVGKGIVHNSPRRGETFVTRKITIALGNILKGKQEFLFLGNLDSLRDWGHAKDYVRAQWMMLQAPEPKDYVISTGEQHSVRKFVELCFRKKGIEIRWEGSGLDEKGICSVSGRVYVKVDAKYFRPSEVDDLLGDSSLARKELGWQPELSFEDLVDEMVTVDTK